LKAVHAAGEQQCYSTEEGTAHHPRWGTIAPALHSVVPTTSFAAWCCIACGQPRGRCKGFVKGSRVQAVLGRVVVVFTLHWSCVKALMDDGL